MKGLQLLATGGALPGRVVTNEDLSRQVDTSDEWIMTRTGIRQRYYCTESEDAATLPVLRPLIGMDKEEIVRIARHIGTFDTSILPYEDCCTVFTPRHPKTKPHVEEVREMEQALDVAGLVRRAMENRDIVKIK